MEVFVKHNVMDTLLYKSHAVSARWSFLQNVRYNWFSVNIDKVLNRLRNMPLEILPAKDLKVPNGIITILYI